MTESDNDEGERTGAPPEQVSLIYANGFQLGLSNADVSLIVQVDNVPQLRIALSYTTAKTLSIKLKDMVETLELATSHTIMTTDEVASGLQKIKDA